MKIAHATLALGAGLLLVPGLCPAQGAKADDIVAKITENEINLMRKTCATKRNKSSPPSSRSRATRPSSSGRYTTFIFWRRSK